MCGIPRPSTGRRIAIMFPSPTSPTTQTTPYSLFFHETETGTKKSTTAVFRIEDSYTFDVFRGCRGIDLRIERHGDLTSPHSTSGKLPPLHRFQLQPSLLLPGVSKSTTEVEFELPEILDLGVSDRGIVGRQVTVVAEGEGKVIEMGMGIVGYD